MALFHTNICSFGNCGLLFATLTDLVQHIEETHITEEGSSRIDQSVQPQVFPLSAMYRVFQKLPETKAKPIDPDSIKSEGLISRKRPPISSTSSAPNQIQQQIMRSMHQRPNVVTAQRLGGEEGADGRHNDSRYDGTGKAESAQMDDSSASSFMHLVDMTSSSERKYACPVSGCKKRYKNLHGVRYHAKVAHEHQQTHSPTYPINRPHKCHCGKAYKTKTGLENHMQNSHSSRSSYKSTTIPAPVPPVRQSIPVTLISGTGVATKPTTIQVTPNQSAVSVGGHQYMSSAHNRTSAAQQQLQQALAQSHNYNAPARTRFTVPRQSQLSSSTSGGITIRPSNVLSSNTPVILHTLPTSNTNK